MADSAGSQTCTSGAVGGDGVLFCLFGVVPVTSAAWLEAGYGLTAALLAVYFIFERSPIHWSRKSEKGYLFVVIMVFQFTSEVFSHMKVLTEAQEAREKLHQVMRRILFVYLYQQNARMVRSTPAVVSIYRSQSKRDCRRSPPHLAIRVAEELESLVDSMLDLSGMNGGVSSIFTQSSTVVILLSFLFVVSDFTWCSLHFAENLLSACATVVYIVMVYGLICVARFYCRVSRLRRQAHQLLNTVLAAEDPEMLEYVMTKVCMVNLMEVSDWETVQLLTCSALEEELLTTVAKIMLIVSLQKKGLKCKRAQNEVKRLLLSCEGEELTAVKNTIDSSGNYRNLYRLIYNDIPDEEVQQEILSHFTEQARFLREEKGSSVGIKVLSDVDDTLYCSGGKFPAGCDKRFPKHEVYPGVLTLFRVLDRRDDNQGNSELYRHGRLVFLSARPHIYKGYAEDHSYKLFKHLHQDGRLHSLPTLLSGKLRQGLWAVVAYPFLKAQAWQPVGEFKRDTFHQFTQLYEEYDFVFFGDNGQGDLLAGQQMLKDKSLMRRPDTQPLSGGPRLLAVVVHEVMPEERCLAEEAPAQRDRDWSSTLAQQGVLMHKSYVGAALALHAYSPDLITLEQLSKVASDAMAEFDRMRLKYAEWGEAWALAEQDLKADLEKADTFLQAAGLPGLEPLHATEELLANTSRTNWERQVRRVISGGAGNRSLSRTRTFGNLVRRSTTNAASGASNTSRSRTVELLPMTAMRSEGPNGDR